MEIASALLTQWRKIAFIHVGGEYLASGVKNSDLIYETAHITPTAWKICRSRSYWLDFATWTRLQRETPC